MIYEKSCGAVVFTREGDVIKYVLVQQKEGFYGFPKGHMEPGESEKETALREIYEELSLRPVFIDGFVTTDEHPIPGKDGIGDHQRRLEKRPDAPVPHSGRIPDGIH